MDTKHTPGPWKMGHAGTICHEFPNPFYPTKSSFGTCSRHIANIADYGPKEENEANARLIAAAPDLLTSLQTLVTDGECYCGDGVASFAPCGWCEAKAAIQKATGGAK